MIPESISRKDFSPSDTSGNGRAILGRNDTPPDIDRCRRHVVLSLASLAGLALLLACVSLLMKWNVPLPRCAFKTVTGLPCFTCGSTRALAALGRLEILEALKFNPLFTLGCAVPPLWLGVALMKASFAPRLRLRLPLRLRTILWLLAAAAIVNWMYLLLELPK